MPILKKKGRAPGAFRTLAKALMHKTVLVPSEAIPEPALTKGKDFVEGKVRGIDKSHYNSLHVKFEGDARKFYFPADCVNQWLVDGTVHLSLPGSSSKEEDARTAADDDEDNTASEELPDAAGIESESTPAPQAGPVPPPDAAAPLGDAARQLSAGNGPAAPLPQASQRAGTASGPDVPQPTVNQQPHEAAHTAAKPAAVAPSTSRQGDEPGFREPTPSAPHPAQPAPSAPKEAPTQPQQPPNGVPQGSQAGKGDQAAGPPNLAAPAATAQVSSRPAAPQLPVVTSAGVWVFAPLPNGGVKPISGPGLTGRFFHKFLYPPSGAAGPSQQGAAAGPSQAPSQGPAQPASSKGEPAGGLQPRLSSCQMQHRKSRLGTETKSGDRQWVADVHVPVEGGVQKRTAPAAPSKAIQQGAGRLLILKQQMRKWKKPSKGVTKRSAVVDIVNKIVEIPGPVFAVDIPDLYYRAKVVGPDDEHANAVVVRLMDDGTKYYFPAGQVREWIEHQAEREKESAAMEVEHATGRDADSFAAEVLTQMSAGVSTSHGSQMTSRLHGTAAQATAAAAAAVATTAATPAAMVATDAL